MRARFAIPALVATLMAPLAVAPTPAVSAPTSESRSTANLVGYIVFTHSEYSRRAGRAEGYQGPGDLRVIASDGSLGVDLTRGPADDSEPVFSPDSTLVAFSSDRANRRAGVTDLYVINVYTNEMRRLTFGAGTGGVSWSPDGTRLVVDDRRGLLVVPANGGKAQRLLRTPRGQVDSAPAWSADGANVLFTRAQIQNGRTVNESIWTAAADGSDAHRLVGGKGALRFSSQPAVSSDGVTIAWVSRNKHGSTIWLADLYFGLLDNIRKFQVDPTHLFNGPAFAPDSSALVVTRSLGNAQHGGELMVADLPAGKLNLVLSVRRGTLSAPNWAN
jgi:dipeptidyl aminopeptidase/acylaminoacyl peptidase